MRRLGAAHSVNLGVDLPPGKFIHFTGLPRRNGDLRSAFGQHRSSWRVRRAGVRPSSCELVPRGQA